MTSLCRRLISRSLPYSRILTARAPTKAFIQSSPFLAPKLNLSARMSSSAPQKVYKVFVCIIPDKPGVIEKRLEVRGQHIANAKLLNSQGKLISGGGYADQHNKDGEPFDFNGSIITYKVADRKELDEILANDIYATSGVWDLDKITVYPVSNFFNRSIELLCKMLYQFLIFSPHTFIFLGFGIDQHQLGLNFIYFSSLNSK